MKNIIKNNYWYIAEIIAIIVIFMVISNFISVVKVVGDSMYPNLKNGEHVILLKKSKIKHNSVIVFNANGVDPKNTSTAFYVKRVIGLPGDKISFYKNNLYLNGKLLMQNYIDNFQKSIGSYYTNDSTVLKNWSINSLSKNYWNYNKKNVSVPKGKYFVMGDNRKISNDSRYWGFVPKNKISGVVKVFPLSNSSKERKNINNMSN